MRGVRRARGYFADCVVTPTPTLTSLTLDRTDTDVVSVGGRFAGRVPCLCPISALPAQNVHGLVQHVFFLVRGVENHSFQTCYAGKFFGPENLVFGSTFKGFMSHTQDGNTATNVVDATLLHTTEKTGNFGF